MEEKAPSWAAATLVVAVGLFVLLGFVSVASYATSAFNVAVSLPMLVVAGAIALLASIAFTNIALSFFGLNDKQQALGLPDGSIRAIIALLLIVIFAIISVHFFDQIRVKDQANAGIANQIITILGTLVTAITSFYFGSRTAEPAASAITTTEPAVTSVSPTTGAAGATVTLSLDGANLSLAQTVALRRGDKTIVASDVLSNAARITCKLAIPPEAESGNWDVVITTSDQRAATLPTAFLVTATT